LRINISLLGNGKGALFTGDNASLDCVLTTTFYIRYLLLNELCKSDANFKPASSQPWSFTIFSSLANEVLGADVAKNTVIADGVTTADTSADDMAGTDEGIES
jgi:hypothetical protein